MLFTSEFMKRIWEIRKALKVNHEAAFKMAQEHQHPVHALKLNMRIDTVKNASFPTTTSQGRDDYNFTDFVDGIYSRIVNDDSKYVWSFSAATFEDPNDTLKSLLETLQQLPAFLKHCLLERAKYFMKKYEEGQANDSEYVTYENYHCDCEAIRLSTFQVHRTDYGWLITREYR